MDKNVYNMKAEKIQKFVKQGDYESAEKLCDTIEWNQVRSARMLSLVSSVYEHVGKYDRAIDILLMAYEEAPVGRRLLYKLTELALAAKEIRDAEDYYRTYLTEAPDDNSRYVLRYKIAEAKNEPIEKKISILEAYKRQEFDEQWAYKLAELYALTNQGDKCAKLCDEIILWFGVGTYVDKALELKENFAPLTEEQLNHRNNRAEYEENLKDVQREYSGIEDIPDDIAAVLARGVAEEAPHIPDEFAEEGAVLPEEKTVKDEIPEVAIADSTPAATESGQALTSLDKSAFLPEDDKVRIELPEEEDESVPFASTRRINAKSDFAKTRIYDRGPGDETRNISIVSKDQDSKANVALPEETAGGETAGGKNPAPINEIAPKESEAPAVEPSQAELTWEDIKEFEPAEKLIYVGTNLPSEAVDIAIKKVKESHKAEGTRTLQITKIPAAKLNTKGVINSLEALKGKDLIILGASALDDAIIDEIKKVIEIFDPTKFFVLADSVNGIEKIRARFEKPQEPVVEEFEEEPVIEEFEEEPVVEEFAAEEPVAKEPAAEEPAIEEPAAEEPAIEEPVAEEITDDSPVYAVDEDILKDQEEVPDIKLSDYFYDIDEMVDEQETEESPTEELAVEATEKLDIETSEELAAETADSEEEIEEESETQPLEEQESASEAEEMAAEEVAGPVESSAKGSMTINDFMTYIKDYMGSIDCVYDEGAEDSVRKYVETLAKEGELLDTTLAVDMVEDAADQAEKHSLGNMFKSKYDKEGHLILRGKNFE